MVCHLIENVYNLDSLCTEHLMKCLKVIGVRVGVLVFNATFAQYLIYIVAVSFIGEGNRNTRRRSPSVASHWQTLSHNVVSSTPRHERGSSSQR